MSLFKLNTSKIPRELMFMVELLKGEPSLKKIDILSKEIDWDVFMELVLHHRLYPIIHLKIKQLELSSIPAEVMEYLSSYYKRNTLRMLQFSAATEQICKKLSNKNIPTILLKGPALADQVYGDISYRTSSDLDFLIPIDKLEQTEEFFVEQGYIKDDYIKTVLNDWKWRHHHVTYVHPQQNIKIEIHWRLHPGPGKEPKFHELWKRKSQSKLTQFPVYLLGKEDLLIYLITHGARHGWSRLRWLVDIQYLMKDKLNWKKIKRISRKHQHHRSLGQGIYLAVSLFELKMNRNIMRLAQQSSAKKLAQQAIFYLENRVNLHTEPVPEEVTNYHKHHLFALMSLQQKLIFILSFLHPYPEDKETLPLPKSLHFLYFPLRPLLWAWRKQGNMQELRRPYR